MGGWARRAGGILGGQDFVSLWLLVLLVESGAGVRAALASASWEGALEGFLLVLASLPAPFLPPLEESGRIGLGPQGSGFQAQLRAFPGAPGSWASGAAPSSGLVRTGICSVLMLLLSPPPQTPNGHLVCAWLARPSLQGPTLGKVVAFC